MPSGVSVIGHITSRFKIESGSVHLDAGLVTHTPGGRIGPLKPGGHSLRPGEAV